MNLPNWMKTAKGGGLISKSWSVLMITGVSALLFYQASFNIQLYLQKPTVFSVTLEPIPKFRLPPISICPFPSFEPVKLKNMGVEINGDYTQVRDNLLSLKGLQQNISVQELWKEAPWNLGQVMHRALYNNSVYKSYNASEKTSKDWYLSYSPMGPCFTHHPPIGITALEVKLYGAPPIKPCYVDQDYDIFATEFRVNPPSCEFIASNCTNSTCGFEDHIARYTSNFDYAYVYFHGTPVNPPKDTSSKETVIYSDQLYDGNHILMQLDKEPNIISQPQLVETNLIKGSCISKEMYNYKECFQNLMTSHIAKVLESRCSPIFSNTLNYSINKTCSSPHEMELFFKGQLSFKNTCLKKCHRIQWNHEFSYSYINKLSAGFHAKTTNMKKVVEVEAYPLAQLFSDIGGSLGLFLGISLLYFWEGSIHLLQNMMVKFRFSHDIMTTLARYVGIVLFAAAACTHMLVSIIAYQTQPVFTSVYLQNSYSEMDDDIKIAVARRLASHSLNCRPQEEDAVKCQVECLLIKAMKDGANVIPSLDIDGLPVCKNTVLSIPMFEYIVPSQLFMASVLSENIETCSSKCVTLSESSNVTKYAEETVKMLVNQNFFTYTILRLICNLGGIVGLYLGYSINDAAEFFLNTTYSYRQKMTPNILQKLSMGNLKLYRFLILISGFVVILSQLYYHLAHHQMSTSINGKDPNTEPSPLVLTVCRWPPFSFDHLCDALHINASERQLRKMPTKERLPKLMQIMQELPGNWSGTIEDIWEKSAWNISDVIDGFMMRDHNEHYIGAFCDNERACLAFWSPIKTQMNRCYNLNLTQNESTLLRVIIIPPQSVEKRDILSREPQLYVTINQAEEDVLVNKMLEKNFHETFTASVHATTYLGLHHEEGSNEKYSKCIQKCLSQYIVESFGCRMPYVSFNTEIPLCNRSQYSSVPGYFKGLYGIGQDKVALQKNGNISNSTVKLYDKCYEKCNHLQQSFVEFSKEYKFDVFPTITLRLDALANRESLEDEDKNTIAQFLSDVGGIAGTAFGLSLAFVLKDFLPTVFGRFRQRGDKVKKIGFK